MNIVTRKVRDIEQLGALDRLAKPISDAVRKATGPTPIKNLLSGTWLGHQLHPMTTDLPIGAWLAAGALDLFADKEYNRAAQRLVAIGIISTLPAVATGASDWSDTAGSVQRVGVIHALANTTSLFMQIISYLLRRQEKQKLAVSFSIAGLATMGVAGYLGGHLTLKRGVGVNYSAFESPISKWTRVLDLKDLKENTPVKVPVGETQVVLVYQNENVYALSASCVHAGGALDEGTIEDNCITCPLHGSKFRMSSGEVLRGPAAVNQPIWEVKITKDQIEIRSSQSN